MLFISTFKQKEKKKQKKRRDCQPNVLGQKETVPAHPLFPLGSALLLLALP